ncbi:hypothetical protein L6V77_34645, partial [Myxococcota bacterium]|nr:hypothetical protein [Myxococcota bacterium]
PAAVRPSSSEGEERPGEIVGGARQQLAGDRQKAAEYLSLAQAQAQGVTNAEHRALLVADLSTVKV